jgi:hypothetical protein
VLGTVSMSSCGAGGGGDLRTGGGEVGRKETDRQTDRQKCGVECRCLVKAHHQEQEQQQQV